MLRSCILCTFLCSCPPVRSYLCDRREIIIQLFFVHFIISLIVLGRKFRKRINYGEVLSPLRVLPTHHTRAVASPTPPPAHLHSPNTLSLTPFHLTHHNLPLLPPFNPPHPLLSHHHQTPLTQSSNPPPAILPPLPILPHHLANQHSLSQNYIYYNTTSTASQTK